MTPLLYFLVFVYAFSIFAFFSIAVAMLSFMMRMNARRVRTVPTKSVLTLFGGTFAVCALVAVVFIFVPWLFALTALCVAASLAIAFTTPAPTE